MLKTFDRLLRVGLLTGLAVVVMPVMLGGHLQAPDQAAPLSVGPLPADPLAIRDGVDALVLPKAPPLALGNVVPPSTRAPGDFPAPAELSSWDRIRILFR